MSYKMGDKTDKTYPPDLKSRDWLLFSTKRLILEVNDKISVQIKPTPNDGRILVASGITEEDIAKLRFLVNNDKNNNYLYLQDFKVYAQGQIDELNLPGLRQVVIDVFRASDIDSFVLDNKLHNPFIGSNFSTLETLEMSFNEFVDKYSALLPGVSGTYGVKKSYQLTLNPDIEMIQKAFESPTDKNNYNDWVRQYNMWHLDQKEILP